MSKVTLRLIKFEPLIWYRFHRRSTCSGYARGAQKRKKDSQVVSLFKLTGSEHAKASCKHVGEIDPRCQFHQHSTSSFYARRSQKRKKTVKL